MPISSSMRLRHVPDVLGRETRQNWLSQHPTPPGEVDDSLTCLNWLHNLHIPKFRPCVREEEAKPQPSMLICHPSVTNTLSMGQIKTPGHIKPPHSYSTLIRMALAENDNKIRLAGIYNWISSNFPYYRREDHGWQNSIRHNLSVSKCFERVARRTDECGKGGFWRLSPEFADKSFRKRAAYDILEQCPKRIKSEEDQEFVAKLSTDMQDQALIERLAAAETVFHLGDDDLVDSLDRSWTGMLKQDIEVGGVRIKTEDIIDDDDMDSVAGSITTSLSPCPSDISGYSDVIMDSMLSTPLFHDLDASFDFPGDTPSFTVNSTCAQAPDQCKSGHEGLVGLDSMEYSLPLADSSSDLDTDIDLASFDPAGVLDIWKTHEHLDLFL